MNPYAELLIDYYENFINASDNENCLRALHEYVLFIEENAIFSPILKSLADQKEEDHQDFYNLRDEVLQEMILAKKEILSRSKIRSIKNPKFSKLLNSDESYFPDLDSEDFGKNHAQEYLQLQENVNQTTQYLDRSGQIILIKDLVSKRAKWRGETIYKYTYIDKFIETYRCEKRLEESKKVKQWFYWDEIKRYAEWVSSLVANQGWSLRNLSSVNKDQYKELENFMKAFHVALKRQLLLNNEQKNTKKLNEETKNKLNKRQKIFLVYSNNSLFEKEKPDINYILRIGFPKNLYLALKKADKKEVKLKEIEGYTHNKLKLHKKALTKKFNVKLEAIDEIITQNGRFISKGKGLKFYGL